MLQLLKRQHHKKENHVSKETKTHINLQSKPRNQKIEGERNKQPSSAENDEAHVRATAARETLDVDQRRRLKSLMTDFETATDETA